MRDVLSGRMVLAVTAADIASDRARDAATVRASVERGDPLAVVGGFVERLSQRRAAPVAGRSTDRPVASGCGVHDSLPDVGAVA